MGLAIGRNICSSPTISHRNPVEKWHNVLNYSSSLGTKAVPRQDWTWVANLFGQAEDYCRRNQSQNIHELIQDIRDNYKTTTYDWGN